jgi:uncharacterized protein (DUF58 family)
MNPVAGWILAALLLALGWWHYGVQGLIFSFTLVVFWLLLQFNRSMRVMRRAAGSPVGSIGSAVMLNAKLRPRMQMLEVLSLTRSLGRRTDSTNDEVFVWADEGGSEVIVTFKGGRTAHWELRRPEPAPDQPEEG